MIIGVVADDSTGSNDIGIMFTKSGCKASVYKLPENGCLSSVTIPNESEEVVVINTNSRLDSAKEAYRKVFQATRYLEAQNCRQYFNKTCSVFRGNIGAEFDAMLDALSLDFGIVVLGFPKNGRTTKKGLHRVRDLPLEESEFRKDPIHPLHTSDLAEILSAQTSRKVGNIYHDVIKEGPDAVREAIDAKRGSIGYVIMDVIDQQSLKIIAEAVQNEPVLCGSSALAEELPEVWGIKPSVNSPARIPEGEYSGILSVAGSLMPQTHRQIQRLIENGVAAFELDSMELFEENQREVLISNHVDRITQILASGRDALLYSGADLKRVDSTRRAGRARGFSDTETARLVSDSLAETTKRILLDGSHKRSGQTRTGLNRTGQIRLVVAGGETSDAVCARLNISGMKILSEIQPGLPSCLSIPETGEDRAFLLVLKSGSFGDDEFLIQALEHLRALD